MLPVLKSAGEGEKHIGDVIEDLAEKFHLTEEEKAELLPSGSQTTFSNRVHWAKSYLKMAGLVKITKRARFEITSKGKQVLNEHPSRIDVKFLEQFPEFQEFRSRKKPDKEKRIIKGAEKISVSTTPDEILAVITDRINEQLGLELLERILEKSPAFFERLLVKLLVGMGYGESVQSAGKALGQSGDNGVDGVINQDSLGLDRVYIQAKRYSQGNSVGPGAIRDFFGSLDLHKASKGLFVTTSTFTKEAINTAERQSRRIVLIDGNRLTQLMIQHNIGCREEHSYSVKKIDEDFFE